MPLTTSHDCPFCAGNEDHTPPPTLSIPVGDETDLDWSVRVVPNLFPAVSSGDDYAGLRDWMSHAHNESDAFGRQAELEGPTVSSGSSLDAIQRWEAERQGREGVDPHDLQSSQLDAFRDQDPASFSRDSPSRMDAIRYESLRSDLFPAFALHGGHEVIVETPDHLESITQLSGSHAAQVFQAYAKRMRHWFEIPGVEYVVTFKNMGAAAGASLRHTHSQLIATSLLPPAAGESGLRAVHHHVKTGHCLMCELIQQETLNGRRVVSETDSLIAFCPFASRLPYMIRVAPKRHLDRFELESDIVLSELAHLTQQLVGCMESMFTPCAYNYTIHTRPRHVACEESYHWWLEIFPRLTKVAGFEWGSDCFINPVLPELAAQQLRSYL